MMMSHLLQQVLFILFLNYSETRFFLYAHRFMSNFTSSKNIGWFIWEMTNQIIHESIARKLLIFTVK